MDELPTNLNEILKAIEIAYIKKALAKTYGKKKKAAKLLGLSFRSFRYRISKYQIDRY